MLDWQLAKHRERLADLLSFARRHIPHYRAVIPSDIDNLVKNSQQWPRLPVLSKQQIQADWTRFVIDPDVANDPTVKVLYTTGSTGIPLKIARPSAELRTQTRQLWIARRRWHPDIMRWKKLNMFRTIESHNQNFLRLGNPKCLDLSVQALAEYVDQVCDYGPDWVYGHCSSVYRLAHYFQREGRSITTLKLAEVTGEQLFPYQRNTIESVFGCPVVNHYGCREFWVLSYPCPLQSMHAWTDDLLLEVVRDGRPVSDGETGELLVTSLTNRVMPFIRYKVGDFVQMLASDCPCGDPRPLLIPVEGRVGTLIVTRNRTITTGPLDKVFSRFIERHERGLLEYQVVQPDCDRLEIYLVPGERMEKDFVVEELRKAIHNILPEMQCSFTFCSDIARMPSGKTQAFISHIT
jgi:phenylacetate-CoA ligase